MKHNIVFFGSGWYTIPVVKKLLRHGLTLVITTDKNPESALLKFCSQNNINTLTAQTASDLINHKSLIIGHDLAVLASYGAFIPSSIINHFPSGIINIHPSLLPKYKGPSPIQYALLNGDTQTGVTLIKLDNEIDHGPILSQKPYNLSGNETSEDLLSILFEIGAEMAEELVIKLENNETLNETEQDHTKETWSYKITKEDGKIDINKLYAKRYPEGASSAYTLNAMIRAFYPWPGVWLRYSSPAIPNSSLSHSRPDRESNTSKLNNKIIKLLPENRIQVEGKNPMSYKDFLNGFGDEGKAILAKLSLI